MNKEEYLFCKDSNNFSLCLYATYMIPRVINSILVIYDTSIVCKLYSFQTNKVLWNFKGKYCLRSERRSNLANLFHRWRHRSKARVQEGCPCRLLTGEGPRRDWCPQRSARSNYAAPGRHRKPITSDCNSRRREIEWCLHFALKTIRLCYLFFIRFAETINWFMWRASSKQLRYGPRFFLQIVREFFPY